jgi:ketosteroid isomerase-like protein
MADIKSADDELNKMILSGKGFPDGFEKYYAEDVVMVEGTGETFPGKERNRKREAEFMAGVQEMHGGRLLASAVSGDVSFSEWEFDISFKNGARVKMEEVARRRWKDGKIVHERFYYNAAPPK